MKSPKAKALWTKILIKKFEKDMKKRSRIMRLLLVADQFLNVLCWNGSQDETVSSHIGRRIENNTATWFDRLLCDILSKFENNHCKESKGE